MATFKKLENTPDGQDTFHTGPFPIRQPSYVEHAVVAAFIHATAHRGFKRVDDFNGSEQNGVGVDPLILSTASGRTLRWHT
jgi:choline dehydrogenase